LKSGQKRGYKLNYLREKFVRELIKIMNRFALVLLGLLVATSLAMRTHTKHRQGGDMGGNMTGTMGGDFGDMGGNFTGDMGGDFTGDMGGNMTGTMGGDFGDMGGNFTGDMGGDFTGDIGGNMTGGDMGEWDPCDCMTSWWASVDFCESHFDEETGCETTSASGNLWDDVWTTEWESYCENGVSFGYDDHSVELGWSVHFSSSDDFISGDWFTTWCSNDSEDEEPECENDSGNFYEWEDLEDFGTGDLADIPDDTYPPPMNFTADTSAGITVEARRRRR
jgi:hypothetical protein